MKFYSNGKLLLTGEYLVLDGAKSLALPTTYGQELLVNENKSGKIYWTSFEENNNTWYKEEFDIKNFNYKSEKNDVSDRLVQIFKAIEQLKPNYFTSIKGLNIETKQDFNRSWGLGTSSTLINNIAQWISIDAYKLLKLTFGGSGYDIACAQNDTSIIYQLVDKQPLVEKVMFNPTFKENIYFVYLNQKQNSRDGIASYKSFKGDLHGSISEINSITENITDCSNFNDFNTLIEKHENVISKIINLKPVKELLFSDFKGAIKSLGAWGGDFVMVTSKTNPEDYFKGKGFNTVIPYGDMIRRFN